MTEVRGRAELLSHTQLLADLAEACGQRGVVDHLAFRLSDPYFGTKLPSLLLFYAPGAAAAGGRQLIAAVLLHEYRVLGFRTGIYIPADMTGDWTVLAPPELREEITQTTAQHLLRSRALVVLLSVSGPQPAAPRARLPQVASAPLVASADRPLLRSLALRGTLDTTLSSMGAHTRRNLRLARRQAVAKLGAHFAPQAELSEDDFFTLNRKGFYPVPDRVARWRFRSARENAGGFIAGVRAGNGDWLALLGGRRYPSAQGACTAVDWQWNGVGFARFSPGSLMRILLIEHELAHGTAQLRFEGGTPHSMRSAFNPESVAQLLYAKPRVPAVGLRLLGRVLPKGNLLGDILTSPHLVWR